MKHYTLSRGLSRGAWLVSLLMLTSCAMAPRQQAVEPLFHDALFQPLSTPVLAASVFELSPAMRRYADEVLRPAMRGAAPEQALVDALYRKGHLQLEYDASTTRNAAQAFEARTGNCLSLVIMTASFARYLGLSVRFQSVQVEPSWSRSAHVLVASGHVNLNLARGGNNGNRFYAGNPSLTVDFLPSELAGHFRTEAISEATVTAMYFNNRAAEALTEGRLDEAYAWAVAAVRAAPAFLDAINTLAVIYQQHGNPLQAEVVLRRVLALTPDNPIALTNLVGVLQALGRDEEAKLTATRLAAIEPYPPFHFFDLGLAALRAGDFANARQHFKRELRRQHAQPEAHFWLAVASLQLGDARDAERHLKTAIDHSTTRDSRALYSAKLDWLREQAYSRGGG